MFKGSVIILFCLFGVIINIRNKIQVNKIEEKISESNNRWVLKLSEVAKRDQCWKNPHLPYWSKTKYAGDSNLPDTSLKKSGSYPMIFFKFNKDHKIVDKESEEIIESKIKIFYLFILYL